MQLRQIGENTEDRHGVVYLNFTTGGFSGSVLRIVWSLLLCFALGVSYGRAENPPVQFVDRAETAGIALRNVSGDKFEYIADTMMGGAAFFDYDNDGDVDLYITNGSTLEGFPSDAQPANRLYRNDRGIFVDVTASAGVGDTSWSMGCVVADYDNDGDADLYVTNLERNILYRNQGDGTFENVTRMAGVGSEGWSTGSSFGDYDRDGDVDLYVGNYVDFDPNYQSAVPCMWRSIEVYCGPAGLQPAANVLYRNEGDGTFTDATRAAGLEDEKRYTFATIFSDYDNDGWPDLFTANDATPNRLYRNLGDGRFEDMSLIAGVAYNGNGVSQGCMGAVLGDYNNDGFFDIFVTNFADEYNTLYKNEGHGFFADVTFVSRIGTRGGPEVAWGTAFFDYDNDGDRDIFVANGHTYPQANLSGLNTSYAQLNYLFLNLDNEHFEEVAAMAGPGLSIKEVSRGAAVADYDDDGDLDIFVLNLNSTPNLLRNDGGNRNNYLLIRTVGTRSNRDGIGTRITISVRGHKQYAEVQSGSSYLSHNDFRIHFGLGQKRLVETLELHWPSGEVQTLHNVAANQVLTVHEP